MDKNAIKKFAVWARTELIARVSLKAVEYDITEDGYGETVAEIILGTMNGKVLTDEEKKQRQALIAEIKDKGYKQVMEEVAYTWFNRFSALRFMEVNGYLPSHVRVFTDEENNFKPQIITEAIHLDLDGLDMEKVFALKEAEKTEELYKYLLIVQCNALNKILPGMFQKIADYTELLLPDNLLREGSVIQQMIELIPEDDWKDAVQIIGWLYEAYNTEKNELVYDGSMSKFRISKDLLPAATTIFTPDWPVRYMVENSLGRLWLEGHPDEELKSQWKYYLEEAEQEPEVQAQLAEIRKEYAALTPEQLKVIDPCSGSGHILVYMFDVLMQIYEAYGYTTREAVASIVENNIYGLDIDERAAQLAYFAVMIKARQYDRRFFSRGIQPHVYAIAESNHVDKFAAEYFCNGDAKLKVAMDTIISELHDAKEYGSILTVTPQDWSALYNRFAEIVEDIHMSRETALRELLPLVQVAEALAQKYNVIVTNPPYLSSSRFSPALDAYVKKNYSEVKSDLSMVVYKHALQDLCKPKGYVSFITTSSWMFLSSFEKLRTYVLDGYDFESLVDFGTELFDGKVGHNPIVAWINRKTNTDYAMTSIRLVDFCYSRRGEKEIEFFNKKNYHYPKQSNFSKIPRSPMAYWWGNFKIFDFDKIEDFYESAGRNKTHNNELYVRNWWEVSDYERWQPYANGGAFRRWSGNDLDVVDWSDNAKENYASHGGLYNQKYCGHRGICWNLITSYKNGFRLKHENHHYSSGAPTIIATNKNYDYLILAFLNSVVADGLIKVMNPTLNTTVNDVLGLPISFEKKEMIEPFSINNTELSQSDWNSFETSWNFQHHPLLHKVPTIAKAFDQWKNECDVRFNQLKANEEELNCIFIGIYGLQDELTPEVEDKDVTVRKADLGRDIRSFISYAVGCMFGRYSLDVDGLAYAGGEWDKVNSTEGGREGTLGCTSKYASFLADKDNIIPICDDEYFEDDIVGRFVEFVKTVYGAATLDENLKFIADALGGKGQPKDVIRNYFLNDFYADHCKIYQKRPIYWLFDSGKKNGFKALIYMHRYQPDTIARIRTDYVHEQQARYRTAIADLEKQIAGATTGERVKLNKKLTTLQAQDTEIRTYEEKLHHLADQMISIDLDDGVKKNYAIFQDVLAKIK